MGVLESVLAFKAKREAEARLDTDSVAQSINIYSQSRQQAIMNDLIKRKTEAEIANLQSEINARDNPNDNIMNLLKIQSGAKDAGNRPLFDRANNTINQLLGVQSQQQPQQQSQQPTQKMPQQQTSVDNSGMDVYQNATAIDPMTGKPTAGALKAQTDIKKIEEQNKPKNVETAGLLAYAPEFSKSVGRIRDILNKPGFEFKNFGKFRVSLGKAQLTDKGSDEQAILREVNLIKKSAFGEGGKQLTVSEKQLVFSAIEPTGKDTASWLADLERADMIINNKAKLVGGNSNKVINTVFDSEESAKKEDLPSGTTIWINGRQARVK